MSLKQQPSLKRIFLFAGWCYVGLIIVWFASRAVVFDEIWWLALINTIAFYLFLPLLLLIPAAIVLRKWQMLAGLSVPATIFVGLFGKLLIPPFPTPQMSSEAIHFMSFNILWSNQNYAQISQVVQSADPDIIGFQEVRPQNAEALKAALSDYPHTAFLETDQFHTVGLASQFPILLVKPLANPPLERGLHTIINVNGTLVNVIVLHLTPNNMPLFPVNEFGMQTQQRYDQRAAEVNFLKQEIRVSSRPTVVLCDCNMTDTSQTYAQLQTVLSDSFLEADWGLRHTLKVGTFPMPLQRVDYVWHTPEFRAVQAYVGGHGGSDHHAAIATLQFNSDR